MAWHSPKALTAAAFCVSLSLGGGGVLGGDLVGGVLDALGEFLVLAEALVEILVEIIEVILLVLVPLLALEMDTGSRSRWRWCGSAARG